MAEILHQLIGSFSHYLWGFIHPRCLFGISAINSMSLLKINFCHDWILQVAACFFFWLLAWRFLLGSWYGVPGLCVVGVVGFFFPGEFVSTPRAMHRFLIERRRVAAVAMQGWNSKLEGWNLKMGMKLRDGTHPQEYPYRIGKARQIWGVLRLMFGRYTPFQMLGPFSSLKIFQGLLAKFRKPDASRW